MTTPDSSWKLIPFTGRLSAFPLDISRICPLASRGFGPVFLLPGPWQRLLVVSALVPSPFATEPCSPSAFPALRSCGSA